MNWFLDPIKNHYADTSGRASRKQFWMFVLFSCLISLGLEIIDHLLGTTFGDDEHKRGILSLLFSLSILVPSIGIAVRRLHDLGRSGWFWLLTLIPFVNLGMLIYLCFDGQPGSNEYGPNPKEALQST